MDEDQAAVDKSIRDRGPGRRQQQIPTPPLVHLSIRVNTTHMPASFIRDLAVYIGLVKMQGMEELQFNEDGKCVYGTVDEPVK